MKCVRNICEAQAGAVIVKEIGLITHHSKTARKPSSYVQQVMC